MRKIIPIILIIVALINQSCDDYVDIEPKGNAIASSLDDVDQLLGNASALSFELGNAIPNLVHDNIQLSEAEIVTAGNSRESDFIDNIYQLEPIFYEGTQTDLGWSRHYISIGYTNHILEVLEGIDTDDPLKNVYEGEAKVHRAYHYFQLVNVYGVHYGLPQAAESGSGVPIVTVFSDDIVPISRNTVNEVYDFIVQDLEDAIAALPNINGTNNRPSKAAALGLLAEVYLHMGDYEKALLNAEDALSINSTVLDYNTDLIDFFGLLSLPTDIDNPENILMKEAFVLTAFDPRTFEEIIFSGYSDELLSISDVDNDLRFLFTIENPNTGNTVLSDEYIFELGITVPKLLLIQAECLARTGDFEEAMNVVNELRANRFEASFVATDGHLLTAANADEAIAHIIDESRREFHVSGKRFFDIKRLNAIENAGISLTRGDITYAPNSINWAMPISENVINTSNGQIQQNLRE
ncbi:RagB/SusD family nutrient uptake outer membrane protein [Flavivirga abyssicola]|uniref:RagB/SusD family nutrient uptake outer membrane protein n=1 Tax=Flavivirga abyssicola TaxID=3063533 RepID=UPI0026DFDB0B|nr:RagB/SusD family nutrient uptake outer membrane protein [Flavivirga sp. MEBiC07777]WVK12634.1 RagB/SusD family nutrient uptake outer membrane protein [Flavivirga sp. MEBiC07777]